MFGRSCRSWRRLDMMRSGVAIGFVVILGGILLVQAGSSYTRSHQFCTSCHVMDGVTKEWSESPHGLNARGLSATCADCHVPPGLIPELRMKLHSVPAELIPWLRGTDTPEKLEARRVELAEGVWEHLRETDSASCRRCHQMTEEVLNLQDTRAGSEHESGEKDGQTCIECHDDGIAHAPIPKEDDASGAEEDFTL
ncbi:MAG: NapC/NirT family cytochrome c [Deltaproteobacteria bacterium]|nr:NapC/NirT family cytochrome c [Deltaproteobacteria bacterium]